MPARCAEFVERRVGVAAIASAAGEDRPVAQGLETAQGGVVAGQNTGKVQVVSKVVETVTEGGRQPLQPAVDGRARSGGRLRGEPEAHAIHPMENDGNSVGEILGARLRRLRRTWFHVVSSRGASSG